MKRILVAAGGRSDPVRVADAAAELAREMEAELTVVSVDDVESQRFETMPRSELMEDARRVADAVVERLASVGLPATSVVRAGVAPDVVLEVADEVSADLIVVGATRRSALAEKLLGSVPLELIRRSERQVLVVAQA